MVEPPKKRRKLPPLGQSFETAAPAEDPATHQGRKRTTPHVEGQWPTHLYIDLAAPQKLLGIFRDVVKTAIPLFPDQAFHSLIDDSSLHLSLSRPLQLWTGQRQDFKSAIRSVITKEESFKIHLAALSCLTNDEGTRSFLTCEVGFGYEKLVAMTEALNNILEQNHLPTYYAEPRFHISIGWWIPTNASNAAEEPASPPLSDETLADLEDRFGRELRQCDLQVSSLKVKIGKDITEYNLK